MQFCYSVLCGRTLVLKDCEIEQKRKAEHADGALRVLLALMRQESGKSVCVRTTLLRHAGPYLGDLCVASSGILHARPSIGLHEIERHITATLSIPSFEADAAAPAACGRRNNVN